MVHDVPEHNVLEHFAADTGEWHGPVVSSNTSPTVLKDHSNVTGPMAFLAFNLWSSVLKPFTETLVPAMQGKGLASKIGTSSRSSSIHSNTGHSEFVPCLYWWFLKFTISALRGATPTWSRFLTFIDFHCLFDSFLFSSSKKWIYISVMCILDFWFDVHLIVEFSDMIASNEHICGFGIFLLAGVI